MEQISILIVEDEILLADNMSYQLSDAGFKITGIETTGEDAIEHLRTASNTSSAPDVVLMDIKLAGVMDGIEAAQEISKFCDSAVIFLTGFGDTQIFDRAFSTKPHAYLLKPFNLQQALMTIKIALYQRKLEKELRSRQKDLENLNATLEQRVLERTEALRKSEERYRLISKITSDYIYAYAVPMDGIPILEWSAGGSSQSPEITTVIQDLMEAGNFFNLIYPEDRPKMERRFPLLTLGQTIENEFRIVTSTGDIRWVRDLACPIWDETHDRMSHIYGAVQDITERKKLESILETERALLKHDISECKSELETARLELARLTRTKEDFLINIGHELRTPLNIVLGLVETMLSENRGPLNEHQQKAMLTAEKSGRHLLELINDLLTISKINANQYVLNPESTLVDMLCQASLLSVKSEAERKNIRLVYENQKMPETIYSDQTSLKQIITHLLRNAVKYTPEDGCVRLSVEGQPEDERVIFSVKDTGIGIAAEDFRFLFNPFVQLESGIARHYEGMGLGLTLVSRLVKMHGGSISVESQPGQGSHFSVALPTWTPPIITATQGRSNAAINNDQPLILVVEESLLSMELISAVLKGHDLAVISAQDDTEAVKLVTQKQPALILLDIQIGNQDASEAIRHLRDETHNPMIPIFALSAINYPGQREKSMEAGANEYFVKPVGKKHLLTVIDSYLNK